MIANSEKIKMQKSHPDYDLCISSLLPLLVSSTDFKKKEWEEGVENYV